MQKNNPKLDNAHALAAVRFHITCTLLARSYIKTLTGIYSVWCLTIELKELSKSNAPIKVFQAKVGDLTLLRSKATPNDG